MRPNGIRTDYRGREYIRVRRPAYPTYFYNGYNFRGSIQDPDSQLRKVLDIMARDVCIDRHGFYMETRVHANGDFSAMRVLNGDLRVRPGYGASFWTALRRAKIIRRTDQKTDLGYWIYERGDNWYMFYEMAQFFTKTHYEYTNHYLEDGDIPDEYEPAPQTSHRNVHSPWGSPWKD